MGGWWSSCTYVQVSQPPVSRPFITNHIRKYQWYRYTASVPFIFYTTVVRHNRCFPHVNVSCLTIHPIPWDPPFRHLYKQRVVYTQRLGNFKLWVSTYTSTLYQWECIHGYRERMWYKKREVIEKWEMVKARLTTYKEKSQHICDRWAWFYGV